MTTAHATSEDKPPKKTRMRRPRVGPMVFAALLLAGSQAEAQTVSFSAPPAVQGARPERSGFTALVSAGVGSQHDSDYGTASGVAGLNFGVGTYISPKTAVLARLSSSNVEYFSVGEQVLFRQASGVLGVSVQHWVAERLAVEGGAGMGFWSQEGASERGLGLLFGATGVVAGNGKHNLVVGAELAFAPTESTTVRSLGFTVGYLFRR